MGKQVPKSLKTKQTYNDKIDSQKVSKITKKERRKEKHEKLIKSIPFFSDNQNL
jgi:hypothetical protein